VIEVSSAVELRESERVCGRERGAGARRREESEAEERR
jgi:hypothetical protein